MTTTEVSTFVLCVSAGEYPASLAARKVYRTLADSKAGEKGLLRVIDESGDDYLYPGRLFVAIDLPPAAAVAVAASDGSN